MLNTKLKVYEPIGSFFKVQESNNKHKLESSMTKLIII